MKSTILTVAYDAMIFAIEKHKTQVRKYTNCPYADHLAQVAGITASVNQSPIAIAVAWLHDCMEDQEVGYDELEDRFGIVVANGVQWLSDMETGNRKTRKELSRKRLSLAPSWVQDIKCADLISNTSSIVMHDQKFAVTYLEEKRLLLDVLTGANENLIRIARGHICG